MTKLKVWVQSNCQTIAYGAERPSLKTWDGAAFINIQFDGAGKNNNLPASLATRIFGELGVGEGLRSGHNMTSSQPGTILPGAHGLCMLAENSG